MGGATGTVNTAFLDAIYKPFADPPEAMMVKQSGFAGGEIVKQFPELSSTAPTSTSSSSPAPQGMQGGGDYMFAFSNSAATMAFVKYITSTEGGANWAAAGFDESPNAGAVGNYPDAQLPKKSDMLANAQGFTTGPGRHTGQPIPSAEWKAIVDVVQGGDIPTELAAVAAAQKEIHRQQIGLPETRGAGDLLPGTSVSATPVGHRTGGTPNGYPSDHEAGPRRPLAVHVSPRSLSLPSLSSIP